MNQKIRRLFVLLALFLLIAALTACGAKRNGGSPATTAPETDGETETEGCAHEWDEGRVISTPDCSHFGTKLFSCRVCGTKRTEPIPASGDHKLSFSFLATEPTATKSGELAGVCTNCGQIVNTTDTATYADYQSKITTAKQKINAFTDSQFGSSAHGPMPSGKTPSANPTKGQHPRLLFNPSTVGAVRAVIYDPANAQKLQSLLNTANANSSGKLTVSGSTENYNDGILGTIKAKALLYQMVGVKLYGYDAIRMIKEFLSTVVIEDKNDACRRYGEVMFSTALVYDWCNDLLTSSDKEQLMRGVQYKLGPGMEMGFEPSKQGAVSGHGCERQLLRDYLSIALAVYDDEETWYKYVGGRIYEEYVPVRNEYYKSGYYPQGISTYLPIRFGSDLWSAWLLESATGKFPYANRDDMKQVMRTAYAHVTYSVTGNTGTQIFSEGDHQGRSGKEALKQLALPSMISAYLFDDPAAMAWADYADYAYFDTTYYLILKSRGTAGSASTRYDGLDLIVYNGGYLGQMIAHNSFETDAASVYMKIGNRMTANHDHADSGSFQIYYKSLLAGDSGYYDKYESDHHKNYHQATIAHNSIVLKDGSTIVGQKQPSETTSFSTWQGSSYKMGTTTGYAYGYSDAAETKPKYAYLAGDIKDAYIVPWISYGGFSLGSTTYLERCDRRMLAVYETGNEKSPLFFFVYDNITSKDSKYQKVFLLHTITEPTISGKKATVVNGDGKLVLQNVAGDCTLSKVGGSKPANWKVGSKTYALISDKSDKTDGYWGRLEVATPSGSNNVMLNVSYVCDKNSDPNLTAKAITNSSDATGAVIGKVVAVFADSSSRRSSSFSFTASGSGTLDYYVSGVKAGNWTVKVGSYTATVSATKDGGLLAFSAPAGTVTLTPQ